MRTIYTLGIILLTLNLGILNAQTNHRFGFLSGFGQRHMCQIWKEQFGLDLIDSSAILLDSLDIHWGREFFLLYPSDSSRPSPNNLKKLELSKKNNLEAIMVIAIDSNSFYTDSANYKKWLIDVAKNYSGVRYFQVHNEVGKKNRFENYRNYFELLQCSSTALKNFNKNYKIIMGSTIPDAKYYEPLIKISDPYVDAYDFHVFGMEGIPYFRNFIKTIDSFNINKPVFITELSTYSGQPLDSRGQAIPWRPFQSEQLQAELLIKMFTQLFYHKADYIFWSAFVEWYNFDGIIDGFFDLVGLIYNGLGTNPTERIMKKKQAYYSFSAMVQMVDKFLSVQKISNNQYKFILPNDSIYIMWSDSTEYEIPKEISDWVIRTNYQGKRDTIKSSLLVLNETPVFLKNLPGLSRTKSHSNTRSISVYPNPSHGIINIEGNHITAIEIKDLWGNRIQKASKSNHSIQLDLSRQIAGLYLLFIHTNEGVSIRKVIIN